MQKSAEINELASALIIAQGKIKPALKDSDNPFFKSRYADYLSVWNACKDALQAANLAVTQLIEPSDKGPLLVTMLIHKSGQWVSGRQPIVVVKNDPQAFGSGLTYARRYGLSAILGMAQDDDDAEQAMSRGAQTSTLNTTIKKENIIQAPKPTEPVGRPEDFIMPFGTTKGVPLGRIPRSDIEGALKWATSKGKFMDFQDAARAFLEMGEPEPMWLKDDLPG